eukprot:12844882-Ditylum_brightwellii.AAC.1
MPILSLHQIIQEWYIGFKHMISSDTTLYFVSDGRECEGLGYFGWVIVTSMDILVTNKGQAKGILEQI